MSDQGISVSPAHPWWARFPLSWGATVAMLGAGFSLAPAFHLIVVLTGALPVRFHKVHGYTSDATEGVLVAGIVLALAAVLLVTTRFVGKAFTTHSDRLTKWMYAVLAVAGGLAAAMPVFLLTALIYVVTITLSLDISAAAWRAGGFL